MKAMDFDRMMIQVQEEVRKLIADFEIGFQAERLDYGKTIDDLKMEGETWQSNGTSTLPSGETTGGQSPEMPMEPTAMPLPSRVPTQTFMT